MNDDIVFNSDKFKSFVHYIIFKSDLKDKTVLYNLLYFSDFNYYELYEVPISGEKYIKKDNIVCPLHFSEITDELEGEGKINIANNRYSSSVSPDISFLSDDELELIDSIIAKLSSLYSDEICEYLRGNLPWRMAEDGRQLNYEAVFYREPEYSIRKYS